MSASVVFFAVATCTSGARCSWRVRPSRDFTTSTSLFTSEMVPRMRTFIWASTADDTSARASTARVLMGDSFLWVVGEHPYSSPHSMFNPFQPVEKLAVERFTALPAKLRTRGRTAWSDPNRQGAEVDSFLEGPSFDREGNLWCVDIPYGRIFRIDPKGNWEVAAQYDGWPNG